jgi:hypothetical protein
MGANKQKLYSFRTDNELIEKLCCKHDWEEYER